MAYVTRVALKKKTPGNFCTYLAMCPVLGLQCAHKERRSGCLAFPRSLMPAYTLYELTLNKNLEYAQWSLKESFQVREPVKFLQKVLRAPREIMQEEGQKVPRRGYRRSSKT